MLDELRKQRDETSEKLKAEKLQGNSRRSKKWITPIITRSVTSWNGWSFAQRRLRKFATDADYECKQAERADRLAKLAFLLGDIERRRRDLEAKRRVLADSKPS